MTEIQIQELVQSLNEPKWTEIVSTIIIVISAAVAAIALLYARKQILYAREQIESARTQLVSDHQRSERKLAMEMCMKWTEFTAPETSSVTKLIERLNPQQAAAISSLETLGISIKEKHHLVNILQLRFPTIENDLEKLQKDGFYKIEGQHLQHIRHIAVRYLNMLESILLAWASEIADHDIIVQEFSYLLDETQKRTAMEEFRTKIGITSLPSISLFMKALRKQKEEGANAKVQRPSLLKNR